MWVLYGNKNVELESLSPADDILATDYKNDRNLWDKLVSLLKEIDAIYSIKLNYELI